MHRIVTCPRAVSTEDGVGGGSAGITPSGVFALSCGGRFLHRVDDQADMSEVVQAAEREEGQAGKAPAAADDRTASLMVRVTVDRSTPNQQVGTSSVVP